MAAHRRRLKDRDQLAQTMSRLGTRLEAIASRKARLNSRIERNQAKVDRDRQRLGRLNERDQADADRYAVEIYRYLYPELSSRRQDAKGDVVVPAITGRLRLFQATTGRLICPSGRDEETVMEIMKRFPDRFFELVRCELRRNPLKSAPDVLSELTTAYAERGKFVSIEPANTAERYRRPLAEFEKLVEETTS